MTATTKETKATVPDPVTTAEPAGSDNERVQQYKIAIAALLAFILGMAVTLVTVSVHDSAFLDRIVKFENGSNVAPFQQNVQPDVGQFGYPQSQQQPSDGNNTAPTNPGYDPHDGSNTVPTDPNHDTNDGYRNAVPEPNPNDRP